MSGPIVIFPLAGSVYEARNDRGLSAQGATPEQALAVLKEKTEEWFAEQRQKAIISPPAGVHPWTQWAGTQDPNDPLIQEWWKAVEEYRAAKDAEDSR